MLTFWLVRRMYTHEPRWHSSPDATVTDFAYDQECKVSIPAAVWESCLNATVARISGMMRFFFSSN